MAVRFSIGEIVKATGGIPAGAITSDTDAVFCGISTDTRTITDGDAFFALAGENHDAHDHLGEAAAKGAALLVVSDPGRIPDGFAGVSLVVADTLRAYQELAAYYRKKIGPLVIAVTGSVGKTTTKDMIGCILSGFKRVYYTQGNLNNQIGLPRTILETEEGTEALVLEMGMSYTGEIERLAEIALPDVCVITNIGLSHRENFDTDEGIALAKYEITSYLGAGGTLVIVAGGNEMLDDLAAAGSREKGFGLLRVASQDSDDDVSAEYIVTQAKINDSDPGYSVFEIREGAGGSAVHFDIPLPGAYAGISAALASAACSCAGVSLPEAANALKNLKRTAHRLDLIKKHGILVIDDTYNASPDSAKSGLDYLKKLSAAKRIAVLADMNELGSDSEAMHREVGAAAVRSGADLIYAYGEKARWIAEAETSIRYFGPDEKEKLILSLKEELSEGSAVYIKGSRSMKMEEVVSALTEDEDGAA